jgi:hypothetical protein
MRQILIRLRTCPTRMLGPYGCEWIETPNLDALAARGIVFDSHYVSGQFGQSHYAGESVSFDQLSEEPTQFLGVDCSDSEPLIIEWDPFAEWSCHDVDWNNEEFLSEIASKTSEFDEILGELIEACSGHLVVLTSLSGFPLGEHDVFGIEKSRLHEELLHIPMIMAWPDGRNAGERVSFPTTPKQVIEFLKLSVGNFDDFEEFSSQPILAWNDNECALKTKDHSLLLPKNHEQFGVRSCEQSSVCREQFVPYQALLGGTNPEQFVPYQALLGGTNPEQFVPYQALLGGTNPEQNLLKPLLFERPDDRYEVNNLFNRQPDQAEELIRQLNELHAKMLG